MIDWGKSTKRTMTSHTVHQPPLQSPITHSLGRKSPQPCLNLIHLTSCSCQACSTSSMQHQDPAALMREMLGWALITSPKHPFFFGCDITFHSCKRRRAHCRKRKNGPEEANMEQAREVDDAVIAFIILDRRGCIRVICAWPDM